MSRARVSPAWIREMKKKLLEYDHTDSFIPEIITYNPSAKWLIAAMASRGFTPLIDNLGAGVKRIGIKGSCYKLCGMTKECSTCEFWKKDGICEQLAEALEFELETDIGVISVKPPEGFYCSFYKKKV